MITVLMCHISSYEIPYVYKILKYVFFFVGINTRTVFPT